MSMSKTKRPKDIKRLNYFTSQFLVEEDFGDEQRYHLEMRRRHNRSLHSWGVADGGLEVTKTAEKGVQVGAGLAIDKEGNEIVLLDPVPVDLSRFAANATLYVTAEYDEVKDPADLYAAGGADSYTRTTERPKIEASPTNGPADGKKILLATVKLNASGNIESIGTDGRRTAGSLGSHGGPLTVEGIATLKKNLTVEGSLQFGARLGELIGLYGSQHTIGVQNSSVYARSAHDFAWYLKGEYSTYPLDPGKDGQRMMSLTESKAKIGDVEIGPGLTVEVEATFKKGLTVEGGAVKLGGFSENVEGEYNKMIFLKDKGDQFWNEQLLKYKSDEGHFKRGGLGIHMHKDRSFGILSSGPVVLFSIVGGTGDAWFKGSLTVDGGIKQEGWRNVALDGGWTSVGRTVPETAAYFKDSLGIVHLRGCVVSPTAAQQSISHISILPSTHRPSYEEHHIVCIQHKDGKADCGHLVINQQGVLSLQTPSQEFDCKVFLDGVTFRA
jgi:hypothetical protein